VRRVLPGPVVAVAVLLVVLLAPAVGAQTPSGALSEARKRADRAAAEINRLETELGSLVDEIEVLEGERHAADAQLASLRERVRRVALERYLSADQQSDLLIGVDINEQERARALTRIVTQSDSDAIDEYRAAKARLDGAAAELTERRADEAAALDGLRVQRGRLDVELAQLEVQEAERIESERRAAAAAAEQVAVTSTSTASGSAPTLSAPVPTTGPAASSATPTPAPTPEPAPPPTGGSGWICPVQGARSFVDSWGAARPHGRSHQGVDLMSPRGTPVVIPVSGVVQLKTGGIGGLTFRLDGDDGNWYYGAHLDAYAGPSGRLPAGTVVGYVGDSGDAKGTGTHLHFEIHIGGYGNPVNPYPTVARHC
jgi:peptidoglycan LD-endopeptidase LytH